MHDVSVSVWNKFWSFPLIAGLSDAGFDVLALGTSRRKPSATRTLTCWSAALATQASYKLSVLRDALTEFSLQSYERFATCHALEARCFWGWSNHHLAAFEKARSAGIPVILETGSTHARWALRLLEKEYGKTSGTERPVISTERLQKMISEYEIADAICVPSTFVARTFASEGVPSEKIHVNPFGADIGFWRRHVESRDRIGRGPCVFVYCGQIMLRKGMRYLLEAWQHFAAAKAELWLIGKPEPACRALMSSLPPNVRCLGEKSHREIRDLYRQCDAYVLPSLEEGLARSTLEAMAAGLPLIVTVETGATDVMVEGEDGWVVPHSDASALAAVLKMVVDNPEETAKRGKSAACRVRPYTWDAYGQRAGAFLKTFLGKP